MFVQGKLDSTDIFAIKRVLICWGCLFCCTITSLDLFILLYLFFGVLFIAFSPKQYSILMYFSLVSFTNIVSIAPEYTISLNWILAVTLICRCFFKKILIYKKPLLFFIVFALYMISGLQPGKAGFLSDIKTIVNYFLVLIIACTVQKIYYKKLFDFYILGHILAVILSFPARHSSRFDFLLAEDYAETMTFTAYRFAGIDFDANFLAANCIFIISFLLFFLGNMVGKKHANKIKLVIFTYIVIGMLTFSKMFMIVLVVLFLTYYGADLSKNYGSMFFMMAFLLVAFFIGDTLSSGSLFNRLFGRFIETTNNVDSFTTGRFSIWLAYIDSWLSSSNNILFGVGMANKRLPLIKMHHNSYIEILYQFGIVGFSIFCSYLFHVAKIFKTGIVKTRLHYQYISLTSICICGMALGFFAFDFFTLQLLLCFLMLGDIDWNNI